MDEEGRRAGRGEGGGDLAADMAGLAHAGDDHPAARGAISSTAAAKAAPSPSFIAAGERRDAARLGLERPQRGGEARVARDRLLRLALGHIDSRLGLLG